MAKDTPVIIADSKPVWQSKTVIGIVIMLLAQIANVAGFQVAPDDISVLTDNADQMIASGISLCGAVLAFYGRIKATKRIGVSGA